MILYRVQYFDKFDNMFHEWFPTIATSNDRVNELVALGMDLVDFEEVELPDAHTNWGDMIRWLNTTRNYPAKVRNGDDTVTYVPRGSRAVPPAPPTSAGAPLQRQEGGDHYKNMAIQPVEYIHANGLDFCEGSVVKYVSRWKKKNGIKDLEKARHFLDILIELEQKKG